jgi:ATP-dependent protease ClpP protease subunit
MASCDLLVSGTIDGGTLPALQAAYDSTCDSVNIIIDSLGGDPIQAIAIGDWLRGLGKPVQMQAIKAYSAASLLWMYGSDDRIKHANAEDKWLMWHRPTVVFDEGVNADVMTKMLGVIQWIEAEMTDIYSSETGLSKDEVSTLMADETYFDDALAKKYQVLAFATPPIEPIKTNPIMEGTGLLNKIAEAMGLKIKIKAEGANEYPLKDGGVFYGESLLPSEEVSVKEGDTIRKADDGIYTLADGTIVVIMYGCIWQVKLVGGETKQIEPATAQAKVNAMAMPTPDGAPVAPPVVEPTTDYQAMYEAAMTKCAALEAEMDKMKTEKDGAMSALEARVEALAKTVQPDPAFKGAPLSRLDQISAQVAAGKTARF